MLFFDLDGTLVDSNWVWVQVDTEFLDRRGLEVTEAYTEFVSHSIFPVAAQFTKDYYKLPESTQEIMEEWMTAAQEAYTCHIPVKPHARAYLEQCQRKGHEMALLTASVPDLCRACIDRHGLTPFFSRLIFAQELGLEKRDPRTFAAAAQLVGAAPEDCTVFDDGPANCVSARAAGMRAVGVYDPFFAAAEQEMRLTCDQYIRSFAELLE
ncbi:MAG: HAD-IA family hydrolase [Oscillospiraceae bacterium]|nr:HAD-IA family hydrolase [Oscillospiraceae bacterium]